MDSESQTSAISQTSRRTRVMARLMLLAMSTALALLIGELVARSMPETTLVRFQQLDERLRGGERGQFVDLVENDPETFWKLKPNLRLPEDGWPFFGLVSNSQGLREDAEIGPKEKGTLRILFLGDSCTYGYGLSADDGISEQVERQLRESQSSVKIECVNAGVPGYSLFQGERVLRAIRATVEPDIVVVCFGWNDGDGWDGQSDQQHYEALQASRPPALVRWSRLCRLLQRWRSSSEASVKPQRFQTRLSPRRFREILESMRNDLKAIDSELVILVPASKGTIQAVTDEQRNLFQLAGMELGREWSLPPYGVASVVDGVAVLQRMLKNHEVEELFLDDVHPTAIANEALAHALCHKILPWARRGLNERSRSDRSRVPSETAFLGNSGSLGRIARGSQSSGRSLRLGAGNS